MNRNFLAGLGAVITIVAMAIDPFSQQILQYYTCLRPLHGAITSIPRTNGYTSNAFQTGADVHEMDPQMSITIYTGLLNPPANSSSSISISCPTGNCTYPSDNGTTFSTLAVSHSCEDISNLVSRQNLSTESGRNYVNLTTPAGAQLQVPDGFYSRVAHIIPLWAQDEDELFAFETLMIQADERPFAFNCSLFPVIHNYGAKFKDSVYNETLLTSMRTDLNTVSVDSAGFASSLGYNTSNLVWYTADCVWSMEYSGANAIELFLRSLFLGDGFGENLTNPWHNVSLISGQPWMKLLYRDGTANMSSVNQYMNGLALSMSAAIRQYGDDSSTDYIRGTVMDSQTCIRVRWAWISLPATLLFLTMVFLVLTVLQTVKQRWQGTWKSSAIALLFHGFDADTRKGFGIMADRSEMSGTSEHVQVQLRYEDGGWTFVERK
ncbi:hypothetical protein SLS58_004463 [Diplodia intermedia]|uniref:Uncharacterized protein n=1 Tax=Diplodia intermedia TaxID=856260 RepID=A0ABR3TTC5_9PEZI